jgi:hypothetical protein
MSKSKSFQASYQVEAEKTEQFLMVLFEIIANTGFEPKQITLPDGIVIPWNFDAAHEFAAEGRISEKEFIEMCKFEA